ncbi:ParB/Srx family N-terminal domain-containing protein [Methylobacterium sp. J-068]|nr:ParB/Srx family N-terminal domain-containing protein [Methylobacterium sp. J-068]
MAASIAAHGLINPLTICSAPKGKFVVVAGQRRLLALKKLAKDGAIPKTHRVACTMRDD